MIRISSLVWLVVLALLGVGLFQVKYAVQAKERELKSVYRQITADRDAIRVLEAEWSYLNDPERLADLARRHTDLSPTMAGQIVTFAGLQDRAPDLPTNQAPLNPPPLASAPEGTAPERSDGTSDDEGMVSAILADMAKAQGASGATPGILPAAASGETP